MVTPFIPVGTATARWRRVVGAAAASPARRAPVADSQRMLRLVRTATTAHTSATRFEKPSSTAQNDVLRPAEVRRAAVWNCVQRRAPPPGNLSLPQVFDPQLAHPGSSGLIWYMMQPAVSTLQGGLEANGFSTTVGDGLVDLLRSDLLATLGPGDVFVWVGVANMQWRLVAGGPTVVVDILRNLTARGVLTVFYSTETFNAHTCAAKRALPVREIWEYTRTNTLCCPDDPEAGLRVRYVPPGSMTRATLAGSELRERRTKSVQSPKLAFMGSAAPWYWMRRTCLRHVARGLIDEWTAREPRISGKFNPQCAESACDRCNTTCPLAIKHSADKDEAWDTIVGSHRFFLNMHKVCDWAMDGAEPIHHSNASCESFRLAALLSAGAEVFSEHCHPADEREYDGLVRFLPMQNLSAEVIAAWYTPERSTAAERAARFAERFGARAIFERAGLTEALAAHRRAPFSSHPGRNLRGQSLVELAGRGPGTVAAPADVRSAASLRQRLTIPPFCCVTEAQCAIKSLLTNSYVRGNMTRLEEYRHKRPGQKLG